MLWQQLRYRYQCAHVRPSLPAENERGHGQTTEVAADYIALYTTFREICPKRGTLHAPRRSPAKARRL
jgi:hypothetical protein